jgi:hypothetical protein
MMMLGASPAASICYKFLLLSILAMAAPPAATLIQYGISTMEGPAML